MPTSRTAELGKLTENSFRDVNIAFANELSLVCDHLGINVRELIRLANHHPRVNVLQPGCGVGGHCIAVDPWFIANAAPYWTPLIQAARRVNDNKSFWVAEQLQARATALKDYLGRSPRIGCLGFACKPDVDDLRESPALQIATELLVAGLDVLACEPNLSDHSIIICNLSIRCFLRLICLRSSLHTVHLRVWISLVGPCLISVASLPLCRSGDSCELFRSQALGSHTFRYRPTQAAMESSLRPLPAFR